MFTDDETGAFGQHWEARATASLAPLTAALCFTQGAHAVSATVPSPRRRIVRHPFPTTLPWSSVRYSKRPVRKRRASNLDPDCAAAAFGGLPEGSLAGLAPWANATVAARVSATPHLAAAVRRFVFAMS
jgi:hypothetical protein